MEKNSLKREILLCDCHSLEHQISIWFDCDENNLYLEPHLVSHNSFFKRLYVGIKYAFGFKSKYGEFDEIVLNTESQKKLLDIIRLNNGITKKRKKTF